MANSAAASRGGAAGSGGALRRRNGVRHHQRAEEEERQHEAAIKERLRQLKLEAARERLQEALSPIEEGAQQLHAAVFEAASTHSRARYRSGAPSRLIRPQGARAAQLVPADGLAG